MTTSTGKRCVTASSTTNVRGTDRQLLVLTRYVCELSRENKQLQLDNPHCLHDIQHLKYTLVISPLSLWLSFVVLCWTLVAAHGRTNREILYLGQTLRLHPSLRISRALREGRNAARKMYIVQDFDGQRTTSKAE